MYVYVYIYIYDYDYDILHTHWVYADYLVARSIIMIIRFLYYNGHEISANRQKLFTNGHFDFVFPRFVFYDLRMAILSSHFLNFTMYEWPF